MMFYKVLLLFLLFIHATLQSSPSIELLNSELKNNYSFVERSLNKDNLEIDESKGTIHFAPNEITIKVSSPFQEIYRIDESSLEIHDIFLDQKQIVDLQELDSLFLNILINGVNRNSSHYELRLKNPQGIDIVPRDGSNKISFIFMGSSLKLIRYIDSLGVEHGIELTKI